MALNVTVADVTIDDIRTVASPPLAQWDRGQILQITGIELPTAYKVEFCNKGDSVTVPMIGNADGVEIPNALLETGKPILAYVVLYEGDNDRETEYWITINVSARPEPKDEVPDPGQQSEVDQLIDALNDAVENAEASAEESATSAEESQSHAQGSEAWAVGQRGGVDVEDTDETYQNNAKYYAGEADRISRDNATLAKSWAVGGTGTRPGEDTNNAKHYAELAAQGAEESGYAWFDVDDSDGCMYVYISDNLSEDVSFAVNEAAGILEVTYN